MKKQDFITKYKVHSKLEEKRLRKKLAHEEAEKLEVLGQSSEKKAKKWIIEEAKKSTEKEKKIEAATMDILWTAKHQANAYRKMLMTRLYNMLTEIDWPKTYEYGVWFDGKGIIVAVKDKFKKVWKRAFMPTRKPKYDLAACFKFAVWAEDVLDIAEGRLVMPKTKGGIWLPSAQKT